MIPFSRLTLLLFFVVIGQVVCAQTFTLSGVIKDSSSLETLPYATVHLETTHFTAQSNASGHFSMRVPKGTYVLNLSYVGYHSRSLKVAINGNTELPLFLRPSSTDLKEVSVTSPSLPQDIVPGRHKVSLEQILKQPSFAGEPDVLKSIQFLPGVKSPSEATTNIAVRGGSYDQTLILLDGAPVYNTAHALGFFSTFNADAIKDVELYKGLMPARYGNRLSSVVDIRMRDGDKNNFKAKVGIGLIASRLTLEGPIKKGTSSFIVSGRYSYAGKVINGLGSLNEILPFKVKDFRTDNVVKFYDLNARINFGDKSGRNRFSLSAYSGQDQFNYFILSGATLMDWGNKTVSFQWNRLLSNRLFMTNNVSYSSYGYHYQILDDGRRFDWNANQRELNVKSEFDYAVSRFLSLNFGLQVTKNNNQPGRIDALDSLAVVNPFKLPQKYSLVNAVFLEGQLSLGRYVKVSAGIRQSLFMLRGPFTQYYPDANGTEVADSAYYPRGKNVKSYAGFEPRVGITWLLSQNQSVKASINQTVQFSHLLTNSSVGLPTDIWVPSNTLIKPQRARQVSVGYFTSTPDKRYSISVEGYFKRMNRVIDFVDNADLFVNKIVETQIRSGNGTAYGVETMVSKLTGSFRYQVAYTLSKTSRKIAGINHDMPYPGRDDRRHALSATGLYAFAKRRMEFSANFVMNSGAPITMPSNTFYYQGALFYDYPGRNQFKLPAYHRLDVSLIVHRKPKKHTEASWIFSVHNLYDRKNVFTAVSKTIDYATFQYYKISGLTPFGIVPSITYNLVIK
ncbi:TonB-dependent receptor [Dyadobacter fermentans]|uniref:TonB-dependent receptor n=1 Tax=Dyadobacter fermentans TaxID=94254 RepID=UPI001CBB9660|nr:TonB-dependent receptor [Dyadobacter fermentans]MBZ1361262.1 TonB-dependent receptor [Dyadobacter fermentans]